MSAISIDPSRQLDIYFRSARNGSKTFTFLDSNGGAYTITGNTYQFVIKDYFGNTKFTLSNGDGLSFVGANGLTITLDSTRTNIPPAEYYWQLNLTNVEKTWLNGRAFCHVGVFDGVTETDTVTIEDGQTITVTIAEEGQMGIQFQDDGIDLGSQGTVTEVDFTGAGVTASRSGDKVTVDITGGGGTWGSITGTLSAQTDLQTALDAKWSLASGGTLTGNNLITGTGYTWKGVWNSLAATQTNGYGLWLANTTGAAAGVQQISPSLVLEGQGWRTNATAESQSVKFVQYVLPIESTANPTAGVFMGISVNGASYIPFLQSRATPTDISPNLFIGQDAGKVFFATNTGYANTMVGFESGKASGGASSNTFLGYKAGTANTTGSLNTYIGTVAGSFNTTGSQNTHIGYHAGGVSTGSSKTSVGYEALYRNTHGTISTAMGWHSLYLSTSGINSAFGHESGGNISTGTRNSIFGNEAGVVMTTSDDNSIFGHRAGYAGALGSDNSFFGAWAGQVATGVGNVYIGKDAGQVITSGDNNIFIGANCAETKTEGGNNIIIGKGLTTSTLTATNEMNIGGVLKTTGLYGTPVNTITGQTTFENDVLISGTRVSMANLPTSAAGLTAGDLWNNGGVINIV